MAQNNMDIPVRNEVRSIPFLIKQRLPKEIGPLSILLGLSIILSLATPNFFTFSNLMNLLMLVPIPLMVAVGEHFVIQTGSIDLSVEGTMAISGVITAMLVQNSFTSLDLGVGGIFAGVLMGGLLGAINGLIFVKAKIPSFIVTLGISFAGLGFATLLYGGNPISIQDAGLQESIIGTFLGAPSVFWWGVGFFAILFFFERYIPLNNHIRAVGGNEIIARQAGIPIERVKILVFILAGMCYGLAGSLNSIRLMIGSSDTVNGFLFSALTAVIVGGTALTGGRGSVTGVLIGVCIVEILGNGLILLSVNPYIQKAVQGIVLILAIAITINRSKSQFVK